MSGSSLNANVNRLSSSFKSSTFVRLCSDSKPNLIASIKSTDFENSCIRMQSMNLNVLGCGEESRRRAEFIDSKLDVVRILASLTESELRSFCEFNFHLNIQSFSEIQLRKLEREYSSH